MNLLTALAHAQDPTRAAERRREESEDPAITARKLLDILAELQRPQPLKVGDLVVQRAYSPYTLPARGKPGIIIEVLSPPVTNPNEDASSSSYRMPLDVIVGCISDGVFCRFHQSSCYLEPYTGKVE